ncbi:MAG TPA: sulfatase-like hydrolase/transferase [Prolixibacteraceae bacterium]|nr:sulfatase-like hydrolase/transferase [Prolixibacteraceae bacterium]
MKIRTYLSVIMLVIAAWLPSHAEKAPAKPNIVLIMADDMGYECLSANGSLSYQTPNLDRIASRGINFSHCIAQPLCTPSRVKIMTGKYNYRNYEYFGYLNPNQKTFGNYLKEAGYSTCIAGKWQLNGLSYDLPGKDDLNRPHHFGFDEYCLWQLNKLGKEGERYANPLIMQNGKKLEGLENAYGPDVFSDFVCDFIGRKADQPFFVYYPMVLVHDPFVPTPDSPEWSDASKRYERNERHFKEMVEYADKLIGKVESKLKEKGVLENTIFIFTGDNGTNVSITTKTKQGPVKGAKSFTIDAGCHVPLIVNWPEAMNQGSVYDPLIEFSDFLPTMLEAAGIKYTQSDFDGKSFFSVLKGDSHPTRETVFVHYDPQWGNAGVNRNRFAQTTGYKLYRDNRFFNIIEDPLEQHPIFDMSADEKATRKELQKILDKAEKESPWILKREKKTNQ